MKKLMADISLDNATLKEAARGKLLSLFRRRRVVAQVCRELNVPGRRACRVLGQARMSEGRTFRILTIMDEHPR